MAFDGRVVFVTGGGSGMGRLAARNLASAGARVAALDVSEALTPDDREYFGFRMPAGTIAGQKSTWTAHVAGQEDPVLELDVCWIAGRGLEPEWPLHHGYTMEVEGNPNVRTRVSLLPARRGAGLEDYLDLSNTITAMPVVAAIPTVHAAPPGIRTYADLPLITGRYAPPRGAGRAR
jgi:hypothetical protein